MLSLVEIITTVQSGSPDRWLLLIHRGMDFRGVKDRPTFREKELFRLVELRTMRKVRALLLPRGHNHEFIPVDK
jgi:hypothetical protein